MKDFVDETTRRDERVAEAVVELSARVVQLVRAEVRQRSDAGPAYSQVRSLRFLKENPGAALSEVADGLGLGAPTISKSINELVEQGMVRRTGDCDDRRRVMLELTDDGQAALAAASCVAHSRIARLLAPLSCEEVAAVESAIGLLQPLFSASGNCERERE